VKDPGGSVALREILLDLLLRRRGRPLEPPFDVLPDLEAVARATTDRRDKAGATVDPSTRAARFHDDPVIETIARVLVAARGECVVYDQTQPKPSFAAATTWIDANTVELRYEFDSEAELDDWRRTAVNPDERRFIMGPLKTPESERNIGLQPGSWGGVGDAVLTHTIPFDAPLNVLIQFRHGDAADPEAYLTRLIVGVCDQAALGHLAFTAFGESFLKEPASKRDLRLQSSSSSPSTVGEPLSFEVTHDGERARCLHSGISEPELPVGSLRSGELFLLIKGDRELWLDSVTIRAKLGAGSRAKIRERWIAEAIRTTGL
jgi:hypothetical protein